MVAEISLPPILGKENFMKTLGIDLETYSSVDLKKCGVYKYAESDDFEIMLFAYSVDGSEVQVLDLVSGDVIPAVS